MVACILHMFLELKCFIRRPPSFERVCIARCVRKAIHSEMMAAVIDACKMLGACRASAWTYNLKHVVVSSLHQRRVLTSSGRESDGLRDKMPAVKLTIKAGVPVSWLRPCYKWHSTNGANKGRRRFKPWRWREVVSMKRLKMQNIQNQRRCGNKGLDAAEGHKYTNSLVPCYQHLNVGTKNRFGFPSAKRFQGLLREQMGFCAIL